MLGKQYLSRRELAALIGMSTEFIKKQDRLGTGCPRIACGRSIRYNAEAAKNWMEQRATTAATASASIQ